LITLWQLAFPFFFPEQIFDSAGKEVDFMLAVSEPLPGNTVLDVCCGPGRHSIALAKRGFGVTGIDSSRFLLLKARSASRGHDIRFIKGDIKEVLPKQSYSLVINLYTSFGIFEAFDENIKLLDRMCAAVETRGCLIIEVLGKEVLARVFQKNGWRRNGDQLFMFEREITNEWSGLLITWIFMNKPRQRYEYRVYYWIFDALWFREQLRIRGFDTVTCYGGWDGRKYDESADRLIVVGRKATR
jgi:SAM-dependent methyltransferase